MVNGRPKQGIMKKILSKLGFKPLTISRQWRDMCIKLAKLLSNHPEEDHIGIITAGCDTFCLELHRPCDARTSSSFHEMRLKRLSMPFHSTRDP
jgi:hypothetical protein